MGLLDGQTHQLYYQGSDQGNYQFVSLEDIINQFMVVYVGEEKIISKASRVDVAFHAQRALAELSFDTFKSIKAQEIVVPASLQMLLPHDYVNYTKLSWVDSSGIKHPLYSTKHTSNPFSINQDDNGNYTFEPDAPLGTNMSFDDVLSPPWMWITPAVGVKGHAYGSNATGWTYYHDTITTNSNTLEFKQYVHKSWTRDLSYNYAVWQELDVSNVETIELSSNGSAQAAVAANTGTTHGIVGGNLKIGFSLTPPDNSKIVRYPLSQQLTPNENLTYLLTNNGNDANLEWTIGESNVTKTLKDEDSINVENYDSIYVIITSTVDFTASTAAIGTSTNDTEYANTYGTNSIDDIIITSPVTSTPLTTNATETSTTWDNYKSTTPSENNNDNYEDDVYWPYEGERYGLEPSHAQTNGSFFIDDIKGKIHFSSNISGKTIVLDYISDSLGTDKEMKVHKFAEEAMYKSIAYAVLAARANTPEFQVARYKKDRFAEVRKAKLRLSNFKLEELTQILRGKSKQIKH